MIHIAHGPHGNNPDGDKCAAEWRYALCRCERCASARAAGTLLTDVPPCSPASIAGAVPVVNDRLSDIEEGPDA